MGGRQQRQPRCMAAAAPCSSQQARAVALGLLLLMVWPMLATAGCAISLPGASDAEADAMQETGVCGRAGDGEALRTRCGLAG